MQPSLIAHHYATLRSRPAPLPRGCTYNTVLGCPLLDDTDLSTFEDLELVCPPTEPKCAPIVACTDGSGGHAPGDGLALCLIFQRNQPGFAFDPASRVRINGGSARAGGSYSAELTGIMAALRSIPLNCDLLIPTDCKSAIPVVTGLLLSSTRRQRLGSRSSNYMSPVDRPAATRWW